MQSFSNSKYLKVLRQSATNEQQNSDVPQSLDVNDCLASVPNFIMCLQREPSILHYPDENFLNSLKTLISSQNTSNDINTTNKRDNKIQQKENEQKQFLGFLLISQLLRRDRCHILDQKIFDRDLLVFLNSINSCIAKQPPIDQLSTSAISAFTSLIGLLSISFDQKQHQAANLVIKNICQNIIRKLDKLLHLKQSDEFQQKFELNSQSRIPTRIALQALQSCLQILPSSFKQVLASNRDRQNNQNTQTDMFSSVLESLVKITVQQDISTANLCLSVIALSFRARDKPRCAYGQTIKKIFGNIICLLQVNKPKSIDEAQDKQVQKALNLNDALFGFAQVIENDLLQAVQSKLYLLFQLLRLMIGDDQIRTAWQIDSPETQLVVEINQQEILLTLENILKKQNESIENNLVVQGLITKDYNTLLSYTKKEVIKSLPAIFNRFGNLALNLVASNVFENLQILSDESENIILNMQNKIQICKSICIPILQNYGLNSLNILNNLLFRDGQKQKNGISFDLIHILQQVTRSVFLLRDKTAINLMQGSQFSMGGQIDHRTNIQIMHTKMFSKLNGQINIQKETGAISQHILNSQFDICFLEKQILLPLLEITEAITISKVYQYLRQSDRIKLQNLICFHFLAVSSLKTQRVNQEVLTKIENIASNLIANCPTQDRSMIPDLLHYLINYKINMSTLNTMKRQSNYFEQQNLLKNVMNQMVVPRSMDKYGPSIGSSGQSIHLASQVRQLLLFQNRQELKKAVIEWQNVQEIQSKGKQFIEEQVEEIKSEYQSSEISNNLQKRQRTDSISQHEIIDIIVQEQLNEEQSILTEKVLQIEQNDIISDSENEFKVPEIFE